MKKRTIGGLILAVILAIFVSGCSLDQARFSQADLTEILDSEWQAYTDDKTNFEGGLAMQILSPQGDYFISTKMGEAMTNSHHFRIASVSKTFTAAAIMLLHQRGLLNINDKIVDNIPGTNNPYVPDNEDYNLPYKNDITIRMLLMHRAGIFDLSNNVIPENEFTRTAPYVGQNYIEYTQALEADHEFTFDELLGVNARNQLSFFEPGSAYHYSDTGYSLLGKIVEQVSQKSYADFITAELIIPNNLNNTRVVVTGDDQALIEPFAPGYVWAQNEIADMTLSNMSPHVAEGSVISTPLDLANWAQRLFTGQAGLTTETVAMMQAGMSRGDGTNSTYGLGVVHIPEKGYGHSGAHQGYLTDMIYNPETEVAYVIFTNIWNCETCGISLDSIMNELKVMSDTSHKVLEKMGY
jgi:D-alanyl-D-alanine carboxypeptidase